MSSGQITLREVLETLRPGDKSLLDVSEEILKQESAGEGEQHTPWFVRALTGVSAWIAAVMFLSFIFGIRIISTASGSIVLGGVIIAAAVFIQRSQAKNLFLGQLAFALSLAGQVLLIGGIGIEMKSHVLAASLATIVLSIGLIFLYPDKTHRFFSTVVAICGAVALVYDMRLSYGVQVLAAGLVASAVHLWFNESQFLSGDREEMMRPVAYGLIVGFLCLLIPSVITRELHRHLGIAPSWLPLSVALTCLLLLLEYRLLSFHQDFGLNKLTIFVLGGTLALAAAAFKAPGIIGALIVLATGFHRGNKILTGLAITFMAVFLSAYYYNMELTLLTKSYALLATGAILLLLRPLLINALGNAEGEVGHE